MATTAQDALLGQNCRVTVTCDDSSVHTSAVTQDVGEVVITPAVTSVQKHNVGDELRHEQQTDEEFTVELRGEAVQDYTALHLAAQSASARRGNRSTPQYTITVTANGGSQGRWTAEVKFCRWQSGPLTIAANNAPVTQTCTWRGYALNYTTG